MYNIKTYLKEIQITKQALAKRLRISRMTLDLYISMYEQGTENPRERYQIIFDALFKEKLSREDFLKALDQATALLCDDTNFGPEESDSRAANIVSRLRHRMLRDMSKDGWEPGVYLFVEILLANYRNNEVLKKLSEYFAYMYRGDLNKEPDQDQIAYFVKFYNLFRSLTCEKLEYNNFDYAAMISQRDAILRERQAKREEQQKNIMQLVTDVYDDLVVTTGADASDEEILRAVIARMKD